MEITAHTRVLAGTSYEVGIAQGHLAAKIPALAKMHTAGFADFGIKETEQACQLFERWCPGLNDELRGFADALNTPLAQILFYAFTFLRPGCSQIAFPPSLSANGHTVLARNYEFNHDYEDFALVKTQIAGKYTHMGTSVLLLGRDEGCNEQGLAVSMSSCGFPVGAQKNMRRPKVTGLQYWAVIRTLLENCINVETALDFLAEMPIAYNINLMLADKSGVIALFETFDGCKAVKRLDKERYLCATNHQLLAELIPLESQAMRHSLVRYDWIRNKLDAQNTVSTHDIKQILLSKYPDGLCCHYYREFFGTTKSIIIDPVDGTIELCWGGNATNGWNTYTVGAPLPEGEQQVTISFDTFDPVMGAFVPITQ